MALSILFIVLLTILTALGIWDIYRLVRNRQKRQITANVDKVYTAILEYTAQYGGKYPRSIKEVLSFSSGKQLDLINPYTREEQGPVDAKPDGWKNPPQPGEIRYRFVTDPAVDYPEQNRTYFSVVGYDYAGRLLYSRSSPYQFIPAARPVAKQAK